MKRIYSITIVTTLIMILAAYAAQSLLLRQPEPRHIKIGFIYNGDASNAYTGSFLKAEAAITKLYGDQIEIIPQYNVSEGMENQALQNLVDADCELIISTSYNFGEKTKEFAAAYPDIQFCQATCSNANEEPLLENYHTFMGEIYQGRYICGVVAGMKLRELIDEGTITEDQALVGYVGAYPYAEVISGYTSFLLGIRSVVPQATMTVIYTNTWGNYALEKKAAQKLIDAGCVIISQHSDTYGPAVACEESDESTVVYHVSYNQNMSGIAPTTHLTGCRINWEPYLLSAIEAVLSGKKIEDCVDGNIYGNDAAAGFEKGWIEMLKVNEAVAADGTQERIDELVAQFCRGSVDVFRGPYIGVDPFDETDICDLSTGYTENKNCSAPTFHYVLTDIITILE